MTSIPLPEKRPPLGLGTADAICSRYGLGKPSAAPTPVTGGLIHRVFHMSTANGVFAIKVLDGDIMQRHGVRAQFVRSERIAAAFAAADVPAVLALEAPGGVVQDIGGVSVIVYPWCNGVALPKSAASPRQARQIGTILGRMHSLGLRLPGEEAAALPPGHATIPVRDWEELISRAKQQDIPWAPSMRAALPDLFLLDRGAIDAERSLPQRLVVSHCDLDQKNVIWRDDDTPSLIDWESAGTTRPAVELVGAALDWSGQGIGPPYRDAFAALINGYRREAEFQSALALPALQCRLADWLGWLWANMHRSLNPEAAPEETEMGIRETTETLATMRRLADGIETWVEWCGV